MSSLERLAPQAPAEAPLTPFRGRRHGEDRLHLLVRDPKRALAIWEISPALHARAESMARAAGSALRYRIHVLSAPSAGGPPAASFAVDLSDALRDESWYVELPGSGGAARAELGLDLPSGFAPLLASRWAPVPPEGPCAETGRWPVDPDAAAWLQAEASRAGGEPIRTLPSSAARYLTSRRDEAP